MELVVGEGAVEFLVDQQVVGQASTGGSFGELALIYEGKWTAALDKSMQLIAFRLL